jgi:pseudouridine-5'-phosphate glycosidase
MTTAFNSWTGREDLLDFSPEVKDALKENHPVVALESTIISHGMPYPQNVETALEVEKLIRAQGAVPATMGIIKGRLTSGLSPDQIDDLGRKGLEVPKVSRRDMGVIMALGKDGATTVASTMILAAMAGIRVFATGGIGGVHRGAEHSMDISADLQELAHTPVAVVCAGAKSILDIGLTLEYLETHGVPVLGFETHEFPAFFLRASGHQVDQRVDSPKELAEILKAHWSLGLTSGVVIGNPIPMEYEEDPQRVTPAIEQALEELQAQHITGKGVTPFLLARVKELTGGESLASNIQLVYNNARLAAEVAVQLSIRPQNAVS